MRGPSQSTAVVLFVVMVLGVGTAFAVGWGRLEREREERERAAFRAIDLKSFYRDINHDSFGGQLPDDVEVVWDDDLGPRSLGKTYFSPRTVIHIDRGKVTTEKGLLHVMRHEMCHVATAEMVVANQQDAHGPIFNTCMERFQ